MRTRHLIDLAQYHASCHEVQSRGKFELDLRKQAYSTGFFTDFFQKNWSISEDRTLKGEENQARELRDIPVVPVKSCSIFSCPLLHTS